MADRGLQKVRNNRHLLYYKGYAQVQLGRDLLRRLQYERSQKVLKESIVTLESGLQSPDIGLIRERPVKTEIYRTLIEVAELLRDVNLLGTYLSEWEEAFPDDQYRVRITRRLHAKFRALATRA